MARKYERATKPFRPIVVPSLVRHLGERKQHPITIVHKGDGALMIHNGKDGPNFVYLYPEQVQALRKALNEIGD